MAFSTLVIDLDDTLYPASSGLWALLRSRIEVYVACKLHLSRTEARRRRDALFRQYGTTMRGLQAAYQIDEEEFLKFVHDVPLWNFIRPDPRLHQVLAAYPQRKVIFSNADSRHVQRVLNALELDDCFEQIVDIIAIDPYCKPMPESFAILQQRLGEPLDRCVLVDDSPANLVAAHLLGMRTVRIGSGPAPAGIDASIPSMLELPHVLPI
jgi:putative hydrolase of the HAD superfamily